MVPLQVYNTFQIPEEKEKLKQTEILIIGGGAVDKALEEEIRNLPNAVYSTYGMTETLSRSPPSEWCSGFRSLLSFFIRRVIFVFRRYIDD